MLDRTSLALARASALWNSVIPRRATHLEVGETHVRYLHPTKGWRLVHKRRLGLA